MPIARAALSALALALTLGACAGDDDAAGGATADTTLAAPTPTPTTTATTPATAANRIAFVPVGNSTLTGDVGVEGDGNGTEVDVTIRNSTDGAVHKGHIHTGTCSAPGGVVAPLDDVTIDGDRDGDADTDVAIPMATVMNGQHIVVYHVAGGTPGAPALCAAIPAHN